MPDRDRLMDAKHRLEVAVRYHLYVQNDTIVRLLPAEITALRSRMRDLQSTVSRYYAATATGAGFEPELRSFITLTQSINDLLSQSIDDKASFGAALDAAAPDAKRLLNGIKYVRNVDQHLLYAVAPDSENVRIVGGTFGMRLFPVWKAIPTEVHAKLHDRTQKLRPFYEALVGSEISGTMMDVLRLFGGLIPEAVHRSKGGEWTGFPLMHQPGMTYPLHPEEPLERSKVHDWLSSRAPNGSLRVALGMRLHEGISYLYGNTWVGRYSFTPFVETAEQVKADMASGFVYLACDSADVLRSAANKFPEAVQGTIFESTIEVKLQGEPIADAHLVNEWHTPGTEVFWDDVSIEVNSKIPDSWFFEIRRARRLNALVPPSATNLWDS